MTKLKIEPNFYGDIGHNWKWYKNEKWTKLRIGNKQSGQNWNLNKNHKIDGQNSKVHLCDL